MVPDPYRIANCFPSRNPTRQLAFNIKIFLEGKTAKPGDGKQDRQKGEHLVHLRRAWSQPEVAGHGPAPQRHKTRGCEMFLHQQNKSAGSMANAECEFVRHGKALHGNGNGFQNALNDFPVFPSGKTRLRVQHQPVRNHRYRHGADIFRPNKR